MLQQQTKRVAVRGTADTDLFEPSPTQEEILHDVGLLLAIALGFAATVSAAFEVGIIG